MKSRKGNNCSVLGCIGRAVEGPRCLYHTFRPEGLPLTEARAFSGRPASDATTTVDIVKPARPEPQFQVFKKRSKWVPPDTGDTPCPHCDRSFANAQGLRIHMSIQHRAEFWALRRAERAARAAREAT